uniref:Uncharacterized protein n=1 Tax=Tanacetum cinerariifolium TaxID=118510 RepID=A0A6L2J2S1_TANCI|nr:hypothetical protein [Tanacetum cinerariifolium]
MIPKTERLQEYKKLHVVSYGINRVARPLLLFFSSENQLLWFSVFKVVDTAYREFLGVGTTFDIFQNILFLYSLNTAYCLLLDTAYRILFPSWSLRSRPTTLGEAFFLARIPEARFEESLKNRFGPSKYEDPRGGIIKVVAIRLKLNLQHELLVSRPTTLADAFSLARITEAHFEATAEKEHNIKEKTYTTLSFPIKEVSLVVKGHLDASEDTLLSLPVDEVISVIEDVFDIDESDLAGTQVRDKFAEFSEDKGSVKKEWEMLRPGQRKSKEGK